MLILCIFEKYRTYAGDIQVLMGKYLLARAGEIAIVPCSLLDRAGNCMGINESSLRSE